ncbi:MAG: hypothetical protein ACM3ZQ_08270 [Bacillota bacterium]
MPFIDQWRAGQHGAELADGVAFGNGRFVMVAGDKRVWWSDDGAEWSPITTDACLHAVTFGGGLFVAVGDYPITTVLGERRLMAASFSPDGVEWGSLIIPDDQIPNDLGLSGVGYGDGLFVAVGPQGRIYTSTNPGLYWQPQLSSTTADLRGVGFGEGVSIAVGEQGTLLISEDHGVLWQIITVPTQQDLVDAAYGMGTFVVIGRDGTVLRSQNRGRDWEMSLLEGAGQLRSIAYGHEAFAVVGDGVYSSDDGGRNWRQVSTGEDDEGPAGNRADMVAESSEMGLNAVTFGQYRFVAVGGSGRQFQSERATAELRLELSSKPDRGEPGVETELLLTVDNSGPDLAPDLYADLILQGDFGIATVQPSRGSFAMINSTTLRYGPGSLRAGEQATVRVVLLPQSRGLIELNADAWADVYIPDPAAHRTHRVIAIEAPPPQLIERWLPRCSEAQAPALRAAAFGNGLWVAVGDRGLIMSSSDDGQNWSVVEPVTDCSLRSVAHGPEGFAAVGEDGVTLWSQDAHHWETRKVTPAVDLYGIACGLGNTAAVGSKGTVFVRREDGGWEQSLSPTHQELRAVTHGGHHYTAVGDHGTVLESPDGWAWSLISCGEECDLRGVAHGRENMAIVAADGSVLTHAGEGWERGPCGGSQGLSGVCHGGGQYLAVGGIFTSASGSDWQECNVGQISQFYGCTYGNGSFVVAGPHGMIMQSLPLVPAGDLMLSMHCAPETLRGQLLRFYLTIENHGPGPAPRVTLTATIPPEADFAWANAVHGECRRIGDTVYCEFGDVHPGAAPSVVIGVKAKTLGGVCMRAVVSGMGYDPDLGNNHAHCTSHVAAKGVGLAIKQHAVRDQDTITFNLRVHNDGPGAAYETALSAPLPEGTVYLSASTTQGLFIVPKHGQHGGILCQIGTIEEGEQVLVRLRAGLDDRSLRILTSTVKIEATNAKTVSSKVVVKPK